MVGTSRRGMLNGHSICIARMAFHDAPMGADTRLPQRRRVRR